MTLRRHLDAIVHQENLNFLLTNRIPRAALTRFVGWLSRIENPFVSRLLIAGWRLFSDLDLGESKRTEFRSLRDCFIRELKDGARPVDPDPSVAVSPCDAIVGACGQVESGIVLQIKGAPYKLADLVGARVATDFEGGLYVTLRLTAAMYHRFHAPCDARIERVTHIAGDTWNVNPVALKRIENLFCKNERAVIETRLPGGQPLALVPVAAILVASLHLHAIGPLRRRGRGEPRIYPMDQAITKGEELGWFEHGSTIIVLAPPGFSLSPRVTTGEIIRMGQPLLRLPEKAPPGL